MSQCLPSIGFFRNDRIREKGDEVKKAAALVLAMSEKDNKDFAKEVYRDMSSQLRDMLNVRGKLMAERRELNQRLTAGGWLRCRYCA